MAANLATDSKGNAMIASRNELPWHQQGTVFTEDIGGREMLVKAGLDWDVLEGPVSMQTGTFVNKATGWDHAADKEIRSNVLVPRDSLTVFPGIKGLYRSDTGNTLGIVGENFKVFQNQSMIDLFENLTNGHKIQYEVAGGLGAGESVWILARIPDLKLDIGGDEMNQYMLIRNGHVGNMTLAVFPTSIRVVCQNTMNIANGEFFNRFKGKKGKRKYNVHTGYAIRHTSRLDDAVKEVEKAYATLLGDFTLTKEAFEAMMKTPMTTEMKNSFFGFVVDPTKDEEEKAKEISKAGLTRQSNTLDKLEKILASPTNQTPASKDTLWGLYNAAVEYVDFQRGTRCTDESVSDDTCKFESAMFGSGAALKEKVFTKALELVA